MKKTGIGRMPKGRPMLSGANRRHSGVGRDVRLGVMQPYFMPYIGYFQLIAAVDVFVVYDNIKYTKAGWMNRNRFLRGGSDVMFSLPIKGDSDYRDIRERELAAGFAPEKILNQLKEAYRAAPYFSETFP